MRNIHKNKQEVRRAIRSKEDSTNLFDDANLCRFYLRRFTDVVFAAPAAAAAVVTSVQTEQSVYVRKDGKAIPSLFNMTLAFRFLGMMLSTMKST